MVVKKWLTRRFRRRINRAFLCRRMVPAAVEKKEVDSIVGMLYNPGLRSEAQAAEE